MGVSAVLRCGLAAGGLCGGGLHVGWVTTCGAGMWQATMLSVCLHNSCAAAAAAAAAVSPPTYHGVEQEAARG
jgi:hypothetical protein